MDWMRISEVLLACGVTLAIWTTFILGTIKARRLRGQNRCEMCGERPPLFDRAYCSSCEDDDDYLRHWRI